MKHIKTQEVRCPHCHFFFCGTLADGRACGNFVCGRCRLHFVINLPLPIIIAGRSAMALLTDTWKFPDKAVRRLLDQLQPQFREDGQDMYLWEEVARLRVPEKKEAAYN